MLFTNCKSCVFFDEDKKCSLGKWDSPGFKDVIDRKESEIQGRFCQFHRTNGWAESFNDPVKQVYTENKLKYVLVLVNHEKLDAEKTITDFVGCDFPPQQIYVINLDQGTSLGPLKETLEKTGLRYMVKEALDGRASHHYIDQYVMSQKLKYPFYIAVKNEDYDLKFVEGLDHIINQQMHQVLFAGKEESIYFLATGLHTLVKSGFKPYLLEHNPETIFEYDHVCSAHS